jgi:hypothetical protein
LAWRCLDLDSGRWQGPRTVQQVTTKLLGLIPLAVLITAPDRLLVTLKHPVEDQARYGGMVHMTNESIHRGLMVVCAIVVLQVLWEIGQTYFEEFRKRMSAMH